MMSVDIGSLISDSRAQTRVARAHPHTRLDPPSFDASATQGDQGKRLLLTDQPCSVFVLS
jgi:hypothetical protein